MASIAEKRALLEVYIAPDCLGCEEAKALAERAQERFPQLQVEIVDLGQEAQRKPEAVIAIPAFLLDGTLLFLGNPKPQQLMQRLRAWLGRSPQGRRDHAQ